MHPYGVFLSADGDLSKYSSYETIVIDAQNFDAEEIRTIKDEGHTLYSYINVGALEDFRDYYDEYKDLSLGAYEHWEEEVWIDVSDGRWIDFLLRELVPELLDKGIDGFFVDNCDVYYQYPTPEILDGLSLILMGIHEIGMPVILNGGDAFLDAYCENGGSWNDLITGINQETVFSSIVWDEGEFGRATEEDQEYFCDYIERYGQKGAKIYLLEYTTDPELIGEIQAYCEAKGFLYYVSDSVELDG